jgi:signal transduction histidine kinase
MRSDDDHAERAPQPSIDGVRRLVDEVSRAGLAANLGIDGRPRPLSRGMKLSAYRIVQEGPTNALRHARAQRVDVHLHYGDDALSIEVRDDGRTSVADGDPRHGLIGVRERVQVYGGEMSTGRGADGGFVLRSSRPIGAGER